jgi:hypothetical protein
MNDSNDLNIKQTKEFLISQSVCMYTARDRITCTSVVWQCSQSVEYYYFLGVTYRSDSGSYFQMIAWHLPMVLDKQTLHVQINVVPKYFIVLFIANCMITGIKKGKCTHTFTITKIF